MNELIIDGQTYITTKRAAEITKYTKDYVGQLARGQKIPARLVGRNWYVHEQAILVHAGLLETSEQISGEVAPVSSASREEELQAEEEVPPQKSSDEESDMDLKMTPVNELESITDAEFNNQSHAAGASEDGNTDSREEVTDGNYSHYTNYESDDRDLFPYSPETGVLETRDTLEEDVISLRKNIDERYGTEYKLSGGVSQQVQNEVGSSSIDAYLNDETEQVVVLPQERIAQFFPSLSLIVGVGVFVFFLCTALALSLIMYPNVISSSVEYSRFSSDDATGSDSSISQQASGINSIFHKDLEYKRK